VNPERKESGGTGPKPTDDAHQRGNEEKQEEHEHDSAANLHSVDEWAKDRAKDRKGLRVADIEVIDNGLGHVAEEDKDQGQNADVEHGVTGHFDIVGAPLFSEEEVFQVHKHRRHLRLRFQEFLRVVLKKNFPHFFREQRVKGREGSY